jgi:hypothetical protein
LKAVTASWNNVLQKAANIQMLHPLYFALMKTLGRL